MTNIKFTPCSVEGCSGNANRSAKGSRGWCYKHYTRFLRYQDPTTISAWYGKCKQFIHEVALRYEGQDCLIWPFSRNVDGYGKLHYLGTKTGAHRVVCILAHGDQPNDGVVAAHSCGNGHLGCVNPHHLSWKTFKENSADQITHGTANRGERNGSAKLSEQDVRLIRKLALTQSQNSIARQLGLASGHVNAIVRKRIWQHVD